MKAPFFQAVRFALDFIFPPVCAVCESLLDGFKGPVCRHCFETLPCLGDPYMDGANAGYAFSGLFSLFTFSEPFQQMIHLLKYDGKPVVGSELARLLCKAVPKDFLKDLDVLAPVPIHHTRQRERGYNQAEVLAREVSRRSGLPLDKALLRRCRKTNTQTRLSREARQKNLEKAFAVCGSVQGKRILLMDDVFTTGATVNECARVLMEAGAIEVRVLTAGRVI